jgi:hypothetical protein
MTIDKAAFAKDCVRQGLVCGVNPHYLLGVAQLRSGISDATVGTEIGPFRFTQADWTAHCTDSVFGLTFLPTDITDPDMQTPVFAVMARRAFDAFEAASGRTPSAKELYLQQFPAAPAATLSADLQAALDATAALVDPAAAAVLDDQQTPPPKITEADQTIPGAPAPTAGTPAGGGGGTGSASGDAQFIPALLKLGSDANQLLAAQHTAAKRLLDFDGEIFPSDGCAITLSVLLQDAGIAVKDTFLAIDLGNLLKKRGWQIIPMGEQKEGDVGSTCGTQPDHGSDHIYLVVKVLNSDEMVVADNQETHSHFRFASGKGKTPTKFFLRAPQ